eukprot:TRINITY_DN7424_c0_g1_i1.p1 TRINITY_DN7424_c0_g1~~TRINITY_DN7424_c0_g1_i1.p1  ORF type:complete len:379 (+),score=21.78 TRINITY_DN7424_c0_g1_i1:342-1478(+)
MASSAMHPQAPSRVRAFYQGGENHISLSRVAETYTYAVFRPETAVLPPEEDIGAQSNNDRTASRVLWGPGLRMSIHSAKKEVVLESAGKAVAEGTREITSSLPARSYGRNDERADCIGDVVDRNDGGLDKGKVAAASVTSATSTKLRINSSLVPQGAYDGVRVGGTDPSSSLSHGGMDDLGQEKRGQDKGDRDIQHRGCVFPGDENENANEKGTCETGDVRQQSRNLEPQLEGSQSRMCEGNPNAKQNMKQMNGRTLDNCELESVDEGRRCEQSYNNFCELFSKTLFSKKLSGEYDDREKGGDCGICLEKLRTGDVMCRLLKCRHSFHKACLRSRFRRGTPTCPVCQTHVVDNVPSPLAVLLGVQVFDRDVSDDDSDE